MRLWVDDERPVPEGWVGAKTAKEAICILEEQKVEEISLDHDLGDTENRPEETGYTVLTYIESRVVWDENYVAPKIHVHTANVAGRRRMELGVESIERFMRLKRDEKK